MSTEYLKNRVASLRLLNAEIAHQKGLLNKNSMHRSTLPVSGRTTRRLSSIPEGNVYNRHIVNGVRTNIVPLGRVSGKFSGSRQKMTFNTRPMTKTGKTRRRHRRRFN